MQEVEDTRQAAGQEQQQAAEGQEELKQQVGGGGSRSGPHAAGREDRGVAAAMGG